MAQFTLIWNNASLLANANDISQQALYRYKQIGGNYISTGFTPANDLAKTVSTVDSPILNDNKVIQFKTTALCTSGGPVDNDNGIQEAIEFSEVIPTIAHTDNSSSISLDVTGLDITKARLTLRKSSDNTIVGAAIIANNINNTIQASQNGLVYSTNYYWQVELYATVNNIEVKSSDIDYRGSLFSPYPFMTNAPAVCNPATAVTVSSIEIV